jgi:HK97 family phage prohead protease
VFTKSQIREAAAARQAALTGRVQHAAGLVDGLPGDATRSQVFGAQMRAQPVELNGKQYVRLSGVGSAYGAPYEVWDMFGPYMETVAAGSGAASLAGNPDVVFLINHKGLSLARTTNATLKLSETDEGLAFEALVNPTRTDAADLVSAIEDRTVTECSFAFRITSGDWSPDYSAYTITGYDINRGDVSACTYGANPSTSIEARQMALRALETLDGQALRAVHGALAARLRGGSGTRYARVHGDLRRLRDGLRQRALSPADSTTLTLLLNRLTAAEAALDPFVEALMEADCAFDEAQMTLSGLLGLPVPADPDEPGGPAPMVENSGASVALMRQLLDAGRI